MQDTTLTPLQRYQQDMKQPGFVADSGQEEVVRLMESLCSELIIRQQQNQNLWSRVRSRFAVKHPVLVKGYYLWGGVGRGKTYIVDLFYDCLPFQKKRRIHFHRFMQQVHHELKQLRNVQNPLHIVADRFAEETVVLCFDEFHVSDITDAMLLGGLFAALFERGITLVTTSNQHPDELYWDGLQRDRFLPAIELIKQHTHIVNLDSGTDYRLRYLDNAEIYHYPLDENANSVLLSNFQHLSPDIGSIDEVIEIEGRTIQTVRHADGLVWFDFYAICDGPRGAADYIELGRLYQTVFIANIPSMNDSSNDLARRFMTLVDEFYDRNVKLIVTASVPVDQLYCGARLAAPFQRTISRLIEMQSHEYLSRQHLSG